MAIGQGKGKIRSSSVGGKTLRGKTVRRQGKLFKENIKNVTRGAIRRMARRGGVKRISAGIYDEARTALKDFLYHVLRDVVSYVEYENKKTVMLMDILFALKRRGKTLYGFDVRSSKSKYLFQE
ncbi:594_t:CDS:2 [Entrophospora sp. SA101]|nr:594_t:CDS:2 [Entrophospora sp. SA101]CAJ0823064.1 10539_t:CDS:2 [Entrophospora sp. SA101]